METGRKDHVMGASAACFNEVPIPVEVLRLEQFNRIHTLQFADGTPADKWEIADAWMRLLNDQQNAHTSIVYPACPSGVCSDDEMAEVNNIRHLATQFRATWEACKALYKLTGGTVKGVRYKRKPSYRGGGLTADDLIAEEYEE